MALGRQPCVEKREFQQFLVNDFLLVGFELVDVPCSSQLKSARRNYPMTYNSH